MVGERDLKLFVSVHRDWLIERVIGDATQRPKRRLAVEENTLQPSWIGRELNVERRIAAEKVDCVFVRDRLDGLSISFDADFPSADPSLRVVRHAAALSGSRRTN